MTTIASDHFWKGMKGNLRTLLRGIYALNVGKDGILGDGNYGQDSVSRAWRPIQGSL